MNKDSAWYQNKKRYSTEYTKNHYEQINLTMPKGTKEKYRAIAESQGISMSKFFLICVEEYVEKHNL